MTLAGCADDYELSKDEAAADFTPHVMLPQGTPMQPTPPHHPTPTHPHPTTPLHPTPPHPDPTPPYHTPCPEAESDTTTAMAGNSSETTLTTTIEDVEGSDGISTTEDSSDDVTTTEAAITRSETAVNNSNATKSSGELQHIHSCVSDGEHSLIPSVLTCSAHDKHVRAATLLLYSGEGMSL
eukprot:CAMPEP_0197623482 /NCGR_PEP_ID=MMETSP1338-20131121/3483_1 /TAXON_ID=43686 ORGANISM="Pelagodinium beii, Strain RCC1491" /NCGR_SAMPLE_ID=MMETSP1338 /ASSEMBLY_ACC=CAM_ASM_000754 /LENGTH=181 /DNA_ID=CAMNT_0043193465 /DNA_START=35 /DNA_END=581 /DNA_ORIENTATION=-